MSVGGGQDLETLGGEAKLEKLEKQLVIIAHQNSGYARHTKHSCHSGHGPTGVVPNGQLRKAPNSVGSWK
ncbi:hypothetical protein GCM10022280_06320 [Sphingomonas swuensis]|uniref:Uncharacterized protein n=1 Tax=Sphingomonas swuensis TaxID=977800 RepID=A0ABP7SGK0_9SPHN